MQEIWKDIPNYQGIYQISNFGNIKSLSFGAKNKKITNKPKILKSSPSNCGYYKIQLYKNGKSKMFYIHRLVAEIFIPNPQNKPQVNHKDGNKSNNHISNLEWCSAKENTNHALLNGLRKQCKPILQLTKNGNIVKKWDSISICACSLNYKISNISACLCKRSKTAYGYRWEYLE